MMQYSYISYPDIIIMDFVFDPQKAVYLFHCVFSLHLEEMFLVFMTLSFIQSVGQWLVSCSLWAGHCLYK